MATGVFVLSAPVRDHGGYLVFGDACYGQTIEVCRTLLDEVLVVGRRREMGDKSPPKAAFPLEDLDARFVIELPDFGAAGFKGLVNGLRLLLNPQCPGAHAPQEPAGVVRGRAELPVNRAAINHPVGAQLAAPVVSHPHGHHRA